MSYHIEINEYQRRLIMKALTSTDVNQFSQAPGSGDAFDTEAKEFVCLVQMELRNGGENYPFERSHRFAVIEPNSGRRDYSRSSCEGGRRSSGLVPASRQDACAGRNCRDFLPIPR